MRVIKPGEGRKRGLKGKGEGEGIANGGNEDENKNIKAGTEKYKTGKRNKAK